MPKSTPRKVTPSAHDAEALSVAETDALIAGCDRFLRGHGMRTPADELAAIAALPEADLKEDFYGEGGTVAALETEVRELLGKPAAVFMPSGTMAQQAALRIHADRRGSRVVALHPTSHLQLHEDEAYQRLHGLVGRPIGSGRELLTLADLQAIEESLAALLIELPQREIGGRLPAWKDLVAQVRLAHDRGWAVHLDGARLWESGPFYDRPLAKIAGLFDSVYVSFYKDLHALAGAALAGDAELIREARVWQRRHGGSLVTLHPFVVSAELSLDQRLERIPAYVDHARALAAALGPVDGVEVVPDPPQTPMFHLLLHGDLERLADAALALAEERGVFLFGDPSTTTSPSVQLVEVMVGEPTLRLEPDEAASLLGEVVERASA